MKPFGRREPLEQAVIQIAAILCGAAGLPACAEDLLGPGIGFLLVLLLGRLGWWIGNRLADAIPRRWL